MPRARKSNLSHRTRHASRARYIANQLNIDEQKIAREKRRVSMARLRASRTLEERQMANEMAKLTMRNRRQREHRNKRVKRSASSVDLHPVAFHYDYSSHPSFQIGSMVVVCNHCGALKFTGEKPGLCCLSGRTKLPPELLHSLLLGETPRLTSFGIDITDEHGCNATFKEVKDPLDISNMIDIDTTNSIKQEKDCNYESSLEGGIRIKEEPYFSDEGVNDDLSQNYSNDSSEGYSQSKENSIDVQREIRKITYGKQQGINNAGSLVKNSNEVKDDCQLFGDFVAEEMRNLKSDDNRNKLKSIIRKVLIEVSESES